MMPPEDDEDTAEFATPTAGPADHRDSLDEPHGRPRALSRRARIQLIAALIVLAITLLVLALPGIPTHAPPAHPPQPRHRLDHVIGHRHSDRPHRVPDHRRPRRLPVAPAP